MKAATACPTADRDASQFRSLRNTFHPDQAAARSGSQQSDWLPGAFVQSDREIKFFAVQRLLKLKQIQGKTAAKRETENVQPAQPKTFAQSLLATAPAAD